MSAAVSPLAEAAEGTCVPLTEEAGLWAVRGARDWYRCNAAQGTCSCADFLYRRARTITPCRHLRMLTAYLLAAEIVRARFQMEGGGEAGEERAPLPSDADLRRIFA